MALREIAVKLGFDFDAHKADEADKKIKKTKESAEGSAQGVGTLIEAFQALAAVELLRSAKEWVEGLVETATELEHTAQATGLSTEELQVWQLGAAESGLRAEEFTLSMRRLSSALAGGKDEAGTQTAIFAKLGIKTKDAAGHARGLGDVLPEIADHFQNTADGAGKAALAQELFGRSGAKMIPLLNKGAAGVEELHKDFEELGGGFSEEMISRAAEFEKQQARLGVAMNSLKSTIGVYLLPYVTDLMQQFTHAVGIFREWAKTTTLVESGVKTLAKAIGFALWGALSPFLFGALKFAAIFLAFDDLNAFLNGERSLIGRFLDAAFGDGTATVVREWIADAVDWFTSGFDDIKAVLPLFEASFLAGIESWKQAWQEFVLGMQETWNAVVSTLHLPDSLKIDTLEQRSNVKEAARNTEKANDRASAAGQALTAYNAASTPLTNQVTAGPLAHNVTYQNSVELNPVVNIQVAAGGNGQETARNIKVATQDAMRQQRRAALQTLEQRTSGQGTGG